MKHLEMDSGFIERAISPPPPGDVGFVGPSGGRLFSGGRGVEDAA